MEALYLRNRAGGDIAFSKNFHNLHAWLLERHYNVLQMEIDSQCPDARKILSYENEMCTVRVEEVNSMKKVEITEKATERPMFLSLAEEGQSKVIKTFYMKSDVCPFFEGTWDIVKAERLRAFC